MIKSKCFLIISLLSLPEHGHSHGGGNHSHGDEKKKPSAQLNMKGVFLHVLADALGSIVVIISALIIWLTDWEYRMYADPTLSICLVVLIMWSTWPLRKLTFILP